MDESDPLADVPDEEWPPRANRLRAIRWRADAHFERGEFVAAARTLAEAFQLAGPGETEVFRGEASVSRRIYELSREVVEFQRAARPLLRSLDALVAGFEKHGIEEELRSYLRDVTDHATTVAERVDSFRQMLQDILTVNATLVTQAQNEEMKAQNEEVKKISAWAAILFAPTLIGTIYGMNFRRMPELHWYYGYPFALALMAAVCATLYLAFKRRGWL